MCAKAFTEKEQLMDERHRVMGDSVCELVGSCNPALCDSWCCKHMVFSIDRRDSDDASYYNMHGCLAVERGDKLLVLVPKVCDALDLKHLTCKIYGVRPAICQKYACHPDHHFKSEYCSLRWKPLHGREAQVALSKMRRG